MFFERVVGEKVWYTCGVAHLFPVMMRNQVLRVALPSEIGVALELG